MKSLIKKLIPKNLLSQYHKILAVLAKIIYNNPSKKMIIIGVTGTNGKSTTVMMIAKILEEAGHKVGVTSTALFKVAEKEWLNDKKMTMLGRFALQKLLKDMVKAGCQYAVIETSSEGIKQFRHLGIHYDVAVFTNLTPEHIEAHGSFENYKKAKLELFKKLESEKPKKQIKKVIIVNADDQHAKDFVNFKVDEKLEFGTDNKDVDLKYQGIFFEVNNIDFDLNLFGKFNIYNSLAAITVAQSQGIDLGVCKKALEKIKSIPGRMEFIDEGQDFKVLVDYAPEPASIKQLYQTIKDHKITNGKIIHVLGSCGGGRDKARQPVLGRIAAENAQYVIVTNEDPYDDDPQKIIDSVAQGAISTGKKLNEDLFKILDRREAIKKSLSLAQANDLVLVTGKGSEQAICIQGGKKIPWDDRQVVKQEIRNLK